MPYYAMKYAQLYYAKGYAINNVLVIALGFVYFLDSFVNFKTLKYEQTFWSQIIFMEYINLQIPINPDKAIK